MYNHTERNIDMNVSKPIMLLVPRGTIHRSNVPTGGHLLISTVLVVRGINLGHPYRGTSCGVGVEVRRSM